MTVSRRFLVVGYGISFVLLAICAAYAFSPRWQGTFVEFLANDGAQVWTPVGFRLVFLPLCAMNFPCYIVTELALLGLDRIHHVEGLPRVFLFFTLFLGTMFPYWLYIGRGIERLRRKSPLAETPRSKT